VGADSQDAVTDGQVEAEAPEPRRPRFAFPWLRLRLRRRGGVRKKHKWLRRLGISALAGVLALTAASFGYNLATDGPAPRSAGLRMLAAGGFDTRYRTWGTTGSPVVLLPGAFETADTFALLGDELGRDHRVYSLDLTGTGYSRPDPPYGAGHLADQVVAFLSAMKLTGANAPILLGHSSGAAVAGLVALRAPHEVAGVVFLDGDATPLQIPWPATALTALFINPYRTSATRLVLRSDALLRAVYSSQCGPTCPRLTAAGIQGWRLPLQQPGFDTELQYVMRHGIPSMTAAELAALRTSDVPRRVVYGSGDPQFSASAAARTARSIGSPAPLAVPGGHLTMITAPRQVADAIRQLIAAG
jgi:pimeloyl-ACP methyl ester carboxylesterase